MNKKEMAMVEELKTKLALRWTDDVAPDVMPPDSYAKLSIGYLPSGVLSDFPRVVPACSSFIHHGIGQHDKTTSQQPIKLYSTREMALHAMRHQVENHCAKILRRIDRMIEDEQGVLI